MRHAVLGAGGIGGLIAGALAHAGSEVVVLLRPQTLAAYNGRITVESTVLGTFEAAIPAASVLDREIDVLWITTKATQLESAIGLAPANLVSGAEVIPLLNGIDHLAALRNRYETVRAAAIRVESERVTAELFRQRSPFLRVELAGADDVQEELRAAGIDCRSRDDELSLLWDKLAFLAPVALTTAALGRPLGDARTDPRFAACLQEAVLVAQAEGAHLDHPALEAQHANAPAEMRSSMQKDIAAGREPELDAIAGPILRGGTTHNISTDATQRLVDQIRSHPAA